MTASRISAVAKGATLDAATPSNVAEEAFTWSPDGRVLSHSSPGTVLDSPRSTPVAGTTDTEVTWKRNGVDEKSRYSAGGAPLACESGRCGLDRGLADDDYHVFHGRIIGRIREKQLDGLWRLRLFEGPLVTTEVLVDGNAAPTLTETGTLNSSQVEDGVELSVSTGGVIEARRFYYASQAPFRLMATAAWRRRGGGASLAVRFPSRLSAETHGWVVEAVTKAARLATPPTALVSVGGADIQYDLVVIDTDSDGTNRGFSTGADTIGLLNEPGVDFLPAMVWHVGSTTPDAASVTSRLELTRDQFGRIRTEEEFFNGSKMTQLTFQYNPVTASAARTKYRLNAVTAGLNPVLSGSSSRTLWRQCALNGSTLEAQVIDVEGRVLCEEEPNSPTNLRRLTTLTRDSNGLRLWVTSFQEVDQSGSILRTAFIRFRRLTAAGYEFESGIGDGTPGQAEDGNKTRRLVSNVNADRISGTKGTVPVEIQERGGDAATTLLRRRLMTYDRRGNVDGVRLVDGSGSLTWQSTWSGHDEDGLPAARVDSPALQPTTTSYSYSADGRIDTLTEPDVQRNEYRYSPQRFIRQVDRVSSAGRVQAIVRFDYSQADLTDINTFTRSGAEKIVAYGYDGFGQMVKEENRLAPLLRSYSFDLPGRVSRVRTDYYPSDSRGDISQIDISRDGMGRTTRLHFNPASADIVSQWDSKQLPFVTSCVVGGRTLELTDNHQRLRLAWTSDEAGADFYEYDVLGRVVAQLRHDKALASGFACTLLREMRFEYGPAGQLTRIRYPSGRAVVYEYGADRSRPDRVSVTTATDGTSGLTQIAGNIGYDGVGAMKSLIWKNGATSTGTRSEQRDPQGRVIRLLDGYGTTANWSDVKYTYDSDGNLLTERDDSSGFTWLRSGTGAGSPTVTFKYDDVRDVLTEWNGLSASGNLTDRHALTIDQFNGRRLVEVVDPLPVQGCVPNVGLPPPACSGATTLTYQYPSLTNGAASGTGAASEVLSNRRYAFGDVDHRLEISYLHGEDPADTGSRIRQIDREPLRSGADMSFSYGPRGELHRVETEDGVFLSFYDAELRRVRRDSPPRSSGSRIVTRSETWRYGLDRRVLTHDSRSESPGARTSTTSEYVWLGGEVIGVLATLAQQNESETGLYHVHSDRMGVPRKVSSLTGSRISRLIMDPWAKGFPVKDISANNAPLPTLGLRYPGQWEDTDVRLVNNGARTLISEIGQYTSPEPLHRQALERGFHGPLAYSFAAANPLRYIDPTGALPIMPHGYGFSGDSTQVEAYMEAQRQMDMSTGLGTAIGGALMASGFAGLEALSVARAWWLARAATATTMLPRERGAEMFRTALREVSRLPAECSQRAAAMESRIRVIAESTKGAWNIQGVYTVDNGGRMFVSQDGPRALLIGPDGALYRVMVGPGQETVLTTATGFLVDYAKLTPLVIP